MPSNEVTDFITDQEMLFARLVLSATVTDRQAAEAVGLDPDTAAHIQSKPYVRAYMLGLRAAMQAQPVQQEAEGSQRQIISREQVLDRLWEIAKMSPDITRNSVSGQVKAISLIVSIEGLIPDRRAARKESAPPPPEANIYRAPWLPKRPGETTDPEPSPDAVRGEEAPADPGPVTDAPSAPTPAYHSSEPIRPHAVNPLEETPQPPPAPMFAPDLVPRVGLSVPKHPFGRRR